MSVSAENAFGIDLARACLEPPSRQPSAVLSVVAAFTSARAGALVTFEDDASSGRVAASFGHSPDTLQALAAAEYHSTDRSYRQIAADPAQAHRSWWNVGFDYAQSRLARDHLVPRGIAGGVTVRLSRPDGRFVGDLHVSTERDDDPRPDITDVLWHARDVLANACGADDVWGTVPDYTISHHFLVRRGQDRPDVLSSRSPESDGQMAALATRLVNSESSGGERVRSTCRWRDPVGTWHVFETSPASDGVDVTVRPERVPFGLSMREVEVLSLLSEGLTNYSIARRLGISERTASHTVARAFLKLDVSSRAAAGAMAERWGLKLIP